MLRLGLLSLCSDCEAVGFVVFVLRLDRVLGFFLSYFSPVATVVLRSLRVVLCCFVGFFWLLLWFCGGCKLSGRCGGSAEVLLRFCGGCSLFSVDSSAISVLVSQLVLSFLI